MEDYQANSKKSKQGANPEEKPKKDLDKVISGEVVTKPKSISSRFRTIFLGGDFTTARQYVISEVALPALRNLVVEVISKGADRLIYGDSVRRRGPTGYAPRVQYNNPLYRQGGPLARTGPPNQNPVDRWRQGAKAFDDIIVSTKEDAEVLVERLIDIVDMYEVVSVADLNELVGLPSSHIDNKWGWTNLSSIETRQVREGYRVVFPPLEEIA